jgi:adenylate kinase
MTLLFIIFLVVLLAAVLLNSRGVPGRRRHVIAEREPDVIIEREPDVIVERRRRPVEREEIVERRYRA